MVHKSQSEQSDEEFSYSLLIDDVAFAYKIIRENRKTISVKFLLDKKLVVKTPLRFSKKDIEDFLKKKSKLIIKRLTAMENQAKRTTKPKDCYTNYD